MLVVQAWHLAGLVSVAITPGLYFWAGTLRNQLESDGFSGEADKRSTLRNIKAGARHPRGAHDLYDGVRHRGIC